jgi:NADPH:quinone reductase
LVTSSTARAVRFNHYGGRDVLHVGEIPIPVPAKGEVLVQVRTAGISPGETNIRTGVLRDRFPATFPCGQGSDLAGVVIDVGPGVEAFGVGDEVLGFSWRRSSHATQTNVPVTQLIRKSPQLLQEVWRYDYFGGSRASTSTSGGCAPSWAPSTKR